MITIAKKRESKGPFGAPSFEMLGVVGKPSFAKHVLHNFQNVFCRFFCLGFRLLCNNNIFVIVKFDFNRILILKNPTYMIVSK